MEGSGSGHWGDAFGVPLDVRPLFPEQRASFLDLLEGLTAEEWAAPALPGWSVQDVVAHVLHDHVRRLAATRDGHRVALPPGGSLPERLDAANEAFVAVARQVSPRLLIDLLVHLGPQLDTLWAGQDLHARADADVSWASAGACPRWLDLARELTELWVHEQQVRDAVRRPGGDRPHLLAPVVDTFARALPFSLRQVERPVGTRARLSVTGPAGGTWDAVRKEGRWTPGPVQGLPDAEVVLDPDTFWRLAARRLGPADARDRAEVRGDGALTAAMTSLLGVVRAPDEPR